MSKLFKNHLQLRILLIVSASCLCALLLLAFAILRTFERSVERSLDAHLAAYSDILIDDLSIENGEPKLRGENYLLKNIPRHWQVASKGRVIIKSSNLANEFPLLPEIPGTLYRVRQLKPDGQELIGVQNSYLFPGDLVVTVTFGLEKEIAERYLEQERDFLRSSLYWILAVVFILLCSLALFISYFATRPISRLQAAVSAVRMGKESRVKGSFPYEIAVVTEEVNRLLDALSNALTRSRTFAANLSHALKTPLTVIKNEPLSALAKEKVEAMSQLIERNLARVSTSGAGRVIGVRTEIRPVVQRILGGFSRIYPVETELIELEQVVFYGDEADLFELLGNIIENACKFASCQVRVTVNQAAIIVEDDGPGVPQDKYSLVLERGCRLDSHAAGNGIGLAVAGDIAEIYSGSIELGASAMSGLKVTIHLPLGR